MLIGGGVLTQHNTRAEPLQLQHLLQLLPLNKVCSISTSCTNSWGMWLLILLFSCSLFWHTNHFHYCWSVSCSDVGFLCGSFHIGHDHWNIQDHVTTSHSHTESTSSHQPQSWSGQDKPWGGACVRGDCPRWDQRHPPHRQCCIWIHTLNLELHYHSHSINNDNHIIKVSSTSQLLILEQIIVITAALRIQTWILMACALCIWDWHVHALVLYVCHMSHVTQGHGLLFRFR